VIPGSASQFFLGASQAAGGAGGFQVSRSLRFNAADSAYLSKSLTTPTSSTAWTFSAWIKKTLITTSTDYRGIFVAGSGSNYAYLDFSDNGIRFANRPTSGTIAVLQTTPVFRDPGAWFHLTFVYDSANSTSTDTLRLYINGTRITTFSSATYPSASQASVTNSAVTHYIGWDNGNNGYLDGYLANIHFIDGQALTPASFAETDATTGQWIPKAFSGGSYGTNGFYLQFADNSSNTASTLGKDTSPNGNNWTPNNFSVDGVIRNYSSNVTTVATSVYSGTPATMFNGGTSIYYGVTSSSGNSSISIDLTGKSVSVSSSIRVYASFRTGQVWQINGSTVSSSGVTHPNTGWQTLSGWSAGAITSFSNSVPSGNANEIYAIEIDGVILTNNTGAGNDSLVDSPTNGSQTDTGVGGEVRGNYCTWNALKKGAAITDLTNGNLDWLSTTVGANYTSMVLGTIGVASGKWYWENTVGSLLYVGVGIATDQVNLNTYPGGDAYSWSYLYNAVTYNNGSVLSYGASYTTGDVIGVALNLDAGTLTFYKNGVSQGVAYSGLSGPTYFPMSGDPNSSTNGSLTVNFGQRPFAYTAPSGFKALCTQNLPAPLVTKSNTVFDVVTRDGFGYGGGTVSSLAFAPDFIWDKSRSIVGSHYLFDAIRTFSKSLSSNTTSSESDYPTWITGITPTGYTLGPGDWSVGTSVVEWCWNAGGSTVSNTQGSITSQVRANATAGFSVVTYTAGINTSQTVGHGLGVAPQLIIVKERNFSSVWCVYHASIGNGNYLSLNSTIASTATNLWNSTSPTSTVLTIRSGGSSPTTDGGNVVAYCFAPVVGYSSFGSYTGNGSSDGPFVYTGMRPRWLMVKNSSNTFDWELVDTSRDPINGVNNNRLQPNLSAAESAGYSTFDILSNGFKVRSSTNNWNGSGNTIIYACFAENPFQYARAR
jgi:hypothetical protein